MNYTNFSKANNIGIESDNDNTAILIFDNASDMHRQIADGQLLDNIKTITKLRSLSKDIVVSAKELLSQPSYTHVQTEIRLKFMWQSAKRSQYAAMQIIDAKNDRSPKNNNYMFIEKSLK